MYHLVSYNTTEDNITRRANEKRDLKKRIVTQASFTTESFSAGPAGVLRTGKDEINAKKGMTLLSMTRVQLVLIM